MDASKLLAGFEQRYGTSSAPVRFSMLQDE